MFWFTGLSICGFTLGLHRLTSGTSVAGVAYAFRVYTSFQACLLDILNTHFDYLIIHFILRSILIFHCSRSAPSDRVTGPSRAGDTKGGKGDYD